MFRYLKTDAPAVAPFYAFPLPGEGTQLSWSTIMNMAVARSVAAHTTPPQSPLEQHPLVEVVRIQKRLTPHICVLECGEQDSVRNPCFHELKNQMGTEVLRSFSATVSLQEPCRVFQTSLKEPYPLGRYGRDDAVEWNDAFPQQSAVRRQLPGPFQVWSATYFSDKYQGSILDVPGETSDFICEVIHDRLLRQRELVLADWQREIILIALPGFFRHRRT